MRVSVGLRRAALRLVLSAAACMPALGHAEERAPSYQAQLRWTAFGIPHVEADSFGNLGFGAGFALAKGNPCLLFDTVLTVRGERSRFFGADGAAAASFMPTRNLDSDLFFRSAFDRAALRRAYESGDPDTLALLRGMAAGVNRFLVETGAASLPPACRNAAWVRPIALDDVLMLVAQKAVEASSGAFIKAIVQAQPPGATAPDAAPASAVPKSERAGSNAYAIGRAMSASGSGILVGNPHFPWSGPNRFFELHLTIPGKLDAMGATLLFLPVVAIGFNQDVAWTHTVSTGARFTLFQLQLVHGHPDQYLVDGKPEAMQKQTVEVPVLQADGHVVQPVRRTLYRTRFGAVVSEPAIGLGWTPDTAFAFGDAEINDTRIVTQWLALDRAHGVGEIDAALHRIHGTPWVNTIAADRHGDTLYADLSVVPNVDDARLMRCKGSAFAQTFTQRSGLPMLDGSMAACDWLHDGDGSLPPAQMPSLHRDDLVFNSNDSFWLANPSHPLENVPLVVGRTGVAQSPRTRAGYAAIAALAARTGNRITPADLERMLLENRDFVGELVVDDLERLCTKQPHPVAETREGCAVLAKWDRRDNADSHGAALFREFWQRASAIDALWVVPFDASDPMRTPRGLRIDDPSVANALLAALNDSVKQFHGLGLAPDAALGDVQRLRIGADTLRLPGGSDNTGVLNVLGTGELGKNGYNTTQLTGSSYMQVVTWDASGPLADALLTYGQRADAISPDEQTLRYLAKRWVRLPFTDAAIERDPALYRQLVRTP